MERNEREFREILKVWVDDELFIYRAAECLPGTSNGRVSSGGNIRVIRENSFSFALKTKELIALPASNY
jgi:hypothetical protein